MKIVLASSSPRRLKLLLKEGYQFDVVKPVVDESRINFEAPEIYVRRLAKAKAATVENPEALVIGADTVVVLGDEFLHKPADKNEAFAILRKLSGNSHIVYTGLAIKCPVCRKIDDDFDSTIVVFNDLTDEAIIEYIESGEPMDKAGAYGIQGMGSFLVKTIKGEIDTVIGFPTKLFRKMLEVHGRCLKA